VIIRKEQDFVSVKKRGEKYEKNHFYSRFNRTLLIPAGSVFAAINGDCTRDKDQIKLKLNNGSCQTALNGTSEIVT